MQGIIFDLDGTLLNTIEDIADIINDLLKARGFATHSIASYKQFVGDGLDHLLGRTLPPAVVNDEIVKELHEGFNRQYAKAWHHKTLPYPQVDKLLNLVQAARLPIAILSNKPHDFTCEMVDYYFGNIKWSAVQGAGDEFPLKPAPASSMAVASIMQLNPANIAFVGDSDIDIHTAKNAGMIAVGAAWGFRGAAELKACGADYVCTQVDDLIKWIEKEIS